MSRHLVILCGGRSAEHQVSFRSASSVVANLDRGKFQISIVGIKTDGAPGRPEWTQSCLTIPEAGYHFPEVDDWISYLGQLAPDTIVFPVLHGPFGEDGVVQGVLEALDLPYVGSGVAGSAVGMNKVFSKQILQACRLPVLPFVSFDVDQWNEDPEACQGRVVEQLEFPVFVKPSNMGSSIGIHRSLDQATLRRHVEVAFCYDERVLVEQGIEAREIEVSVLGNFSPRASLPGEIIPSAEFYTYQAKYLDGSSQLVIPALLPHEMCESLQETAIEVFLSLQLEGMARVDFLLEKDSDRYWVNEANTIPGFTQISMYPKLWEVSGLEYGCLLEELVALALERHQRRANFSVDWQAETL